MTLSKEQRQLAGLEPVRQSMFLSSGSLRVARPGAKEVNEANNFLHALMHPSKGSLPKVPKHATPTRLAGGREAVIRQLMQEFPHALTSFGGRDNIEQIVWEGDPKKLGPYARKIKKRYRELMIAAGEMDARAVREHKTPGLAPQLELTRFNERGAFSISRPISVPKYDDPLHDGYTADEVLSEARKGFSRVNATQISRRACLSEADVWPRDVKIVSKKWLERPGPARGGLSKPEYKLHAVASAKGEKYEISTPWLVDKADEKNWVFAIQTELSKFLRKGKADRILSAATGKMASVDDRKLAIV
jgi:hypothetical protein